MAKKKSTLDTAGGEPLTDSSATATGNGAPPEAVPPPLPETPPPLPGLSDHEPQLAPADAPVAQVAASAVDPALDERLRRLEAMLAQVPNLQALEQRVAERVASQIQQPPAPQAAPPSGSASGMLGQARALIDVGRHLLPALPPGQAPARPRGWLLWEMIAELRAMFLMYVDPRYRVSWYAYVLPPGLFVAFLFTKFWFPFGLTLEKMNMAWIVVVPVDLLLLYSMFKIMGHEARRYRETAPDLPPSLRL